MSWLAPYLPWLGLPLAAGLTLLLAHWARVRGLTDAAVGPAAERKLQERPVPPVGGLAIFLALGGLCLAFGWGQDWELRLPGFTLLIAPGVVWVSLFLVLVVGIWDDLMPAGLGPMGKLSGQAFALLPLAIGAVGAVVGPGETEVLRPALLGLSILGGGLLALNVLNTFDNADGAATGMASLGFCAAFLGLGSLALGPLGAALGPAALGFLLCNLNASSKAAGPLGSGTPSAYLGDSGAFLLALLLLLVPYGWAALWIPFLDLARLSVLRWHQGSRPWIGDRRHLAHRLQRCGLPSRGVVLVLVLNAVPACAGMYWQGRGPAAPAIGFLLGSLSYATTLWVSRAGSLPRNSQ